MIGETIEQYRILEVVGRGGMGVVYKALDVNLDRAVALKVLGAEFRDDPDFVERFRNEARVQAALNHPNVCTLFDFLLWNGSPVAVMEFIAGETLQSLIRRRGPVPAHLALPIFVQALQGVAAGHRRGIIHRDLKPANLMITEEGIVKVTDFGIAKMQNAAVHTQSSTRVGSASYMSPEQILGRAVDVRTDIYAMGCTLYELLCGRPPFQAKALFEIESAHVRDVPLPPTAYYPHIPPGAVDAVLRALAKDPAQRFASAEEFMQALPNLHGEPFVAVPGTEAAAAATLFRAPPSPAAAAAPSVAIPSAAIPRSSAGAAKKVGILAGAILAVLLAGAALLRWAGGPRPAAVAAQTEQPSPQREPQAPPPAQAQPQRQPTAPLPAPTEAGQQSSPDAPSAQQQSPAASAQSQPTTPTARLPVAHQPAARTPPRTTSAPHDLSGVWTGVYADAAGQAALRVSALELRQLPDDSITGRLTYATEGGGEDTCSLERSSFYPKKHQLRLLVHCAASHPKYLNVPLDFAGVDPNSSSLAGGRLESPLWHEIVVTLTRTKKL